MKKKAGRSFWYPKPEGRRVKQPETLSQLAAQLRGLAKEGKLTARGKRRLQQLKDKGY